MKPKQDIMTVVKTDKKLRKQIREFLLAYRKENEYYLVWEDKMFINILEKYLLSLEKK